MTGPFDPPDAQSVLDLIAGYPLAWVVSTSFEASPLPLLAETGDDGAVKALLGHVPLANPLVPALRTDPRALILFQGPQGYVSPEPLSNRDWAPTWNFAVARFVTEIEFVPGETGEALERLVGEMERGRPRPWTTAEMGARYDQLASRVIAFRAHVRSSSARFKLGQDERPEVLRELLAGAEDTVLAKWMRRFNFKRI